MKKHCVIALLAIFSLQIGAGCADGKSNKRAVINANQLGKSTPQGAQPVTPANGDQNGSGTGDVVQPQPDIENPDAEVQKSVNDVIEKFTKLKVAGEAVEFDSLKAINLELQEVGLLYTQNQSDLSDQSMAAFAHYKVEKSEDGSFNFIPAAASEVVGAAANITLLGLPVLNQVEIAADGSTPSIDRSSELVLFPQVKDQKMTLMNDAEQATKLAVLEPVFDRIFTLVKEGDFGLSTSTGAQVFTEIVKSDDAVSMLIEARIGESKVQTFLLKFKTSSSAENQNKVTQ